jgi:hypothetical protein
LLPKENFSIEWLFGLVFGASDKRLVYIDFTHPKVKTAFSVQYDSEYELTFRHSMHEWLQAFSEKRAKMINVVESNPEIGWIKLVQINEQVLTQDKLGNQI